MKFEAGMPRPEGAGRKKGTPNKKTATFNELLEALNIEPVSELVALKDKLSSKEWADVLRDLISYIYPKRKAIEHEVEVSTDSRTLTDDQLQAMTLLIRRDLHGEPLPSEMLENIERVQDMLNLAKEK